MAPTEFENLPEPPEYWDELIWMVLTVRDKQALNPRASACDLKLSALFNQTQTSGVLNILQFRDAIVEYLKTLPVAASTRTRKQRL